MLQLSNRERFLSRHNSLHRPHDDNDGSYLKLRYDYSHLPYQKMGSLRYLLNLEGLTNFEIKTMKLPNIMDLNDYSRNVA